MTTSAQWGHTSCMSGRKGSDQNICQPSVPMPHAAKALPASRAWRVPNGWCGVRRLSRCDDETYQVLASRLVIVG